MLQILATRMIHLQIKDGGGIVSRNGCSKVTEAKSTKKRSGFYRRNSKRTSEKHRPVWLLLRQEHPSSSSCCSRSCWCCLPSNGTHGHNQRRLVKSGPRRERTELPPQSAETVSGRTKAVP